MKKYLAPLSGLVLAFIATAQNYQKIVLDKNDAERGYYFAIPPQDEVKGVLVLFPGYAETPEMVLPEKKLHNTAFTNNLMTLVIPIGAKIYADEPTLSAINRALTDSIKRFRLDNKKMVVGGFSAGGTIALRYAEKCMERPGDFPIEPKAVFAVDSPVDIINLFGYFYRERAKNFSEAGVNEANFVQPIMEKELGGTPATNLKNYIANSPFYAASNEPGNERFLKNTAVRVYHDMDVVWQLQNRRRSLYDNNALCSSELINRLLLMGNDKAAFVQSDRKGYRSNGMRHTHSWSIVDEVECIQWIKEVLNI
ncbi:MAG: hypothetical protein ACKO13_13735 [Cytophagales bacterium]